jgi:hypothetical protein
LLPSAAWGNGSVSLERKLVCQGADHLRAIPHIWDIIRQGRQVGFGTDIRIELLAGATSNSPSFSPDDVSRVYDGKHARVLNASSKSRGAEIARQMASHGV